MKTICFYFQLHHPLLLKRYRFFEIGSDHYYYDHYNNEALTRQLVDECYRPSNEMILDMIKSSNGKFKVSFSISGVTLERLEQYAPEVIDSFKALAKTGNVEFLAETYAHSLASIFDEDEFKEQVKKHSDKIQSLFGKRPTVFKNTSLIYSDDIGRLVAQMGYKGMMVEGAKQVLGWKSPNYLYAHPQNPRFKLLTRNFKLSDDLSLRFSNWQWDQYPLTAEKYIDWIANTDEKEEFICLGMSYRTLGLMNKKESGIFDFFKALPYHALLRKVTFSTPSEVIDKVKSTDTITSNETVSWTDEEKDLSAWIGNDLQNEAIQTLYNIGERVRLSSDPLLLEDWMRLQSSEHFYFMKTKYSSSGTVAAFQPYESPYEAFMNYMNVLSDFLQRVEDEYPTSIETEELNSLLKTIRNQASEIEELKKQLKKTKEKSGPKTKTSATKG